MKTFRSSKELDEDIKRAEAECSEKLCLIEIYTPQMVHKVTDVLEQMETQK